MSPGLKYRSISSVPSALKYTHFEVIRHPIWFASSQHDTTFDVNTGKADLKTNKESTFKKINLEAAKEIALQMKLRNISGIIIVDFINMSNNKDYDILTHEMSEYLTNDFSISNVVDITKLGLMELTRKKKEKSLEEIVNEKKDDN